MAGSSRLVNFAPLQLCNFYDDYFLVHNICFIDDFAAGGGGGGLAAAVSSTLGAVWRGDADSRTVDGCFTLDGDVLVFTLAGGPLFERAIVMTLHVSASVLVWQAFKRRNPFYFVLAVVYHAQFDATAVYVAQFIENACVQVEVWELPPLSSQCEREQITGQG